ncbi:MAG TPA: glycoside hydrolase family 57 protein [Candidatus Dojkabacteria bacterium]|nr:glycoside hydrolase family 57 protein [Candidatus Dojkabacteria bacterium]HRO65108.1 glycoside hydrolase family 57 protein [Candidatus Dojkabacteria bacterium]HRP51280.1 glycoside hydrolase family 57 protein [Candidatus Dojkabacteria bacterium]
MKIKENTNYRKSVCFYFQVHQPLRLTQFNYFNKGNTSGYFKGDLPHTNKFFIEKVGKKSYHPTNNLLLNLLANHKEFKCSFSISGIALEQFEKYDPTLIESFQSLVKTRRVELLSETYYHSLSWIYSKQEFAEQIILHRKKIYKLFKKRPKVFRNTELIYNNELANFIRKMGFDAILAEGWDYYLKSKSPNYVYNAPKFDLHPEDEKIIRNYKIKDRANRKIALLLKNYKLSDDIAFRFSDVNWKEHPLSVEKFVDWVEQADGETINLFMDYETFGEHQWEDSGIFKFLEMLPAELIRRGIGFRTPSETVRDFEARDEIDIHNLISWADIERDLSAWLGNKMQRHAADQIYKYEQLVRSAIGTISDKLTKRKLLSTWRKLQTSDHFYYMSTKYWNDGDIHKYFSPYESPYDAYINYMNVVSDFSDKLKQMVSYKSYLKND